MILGCRRTRSILEAKRQIWQIGLRPSLERSPYSALEVRHFKRTHLNTSETHQHPIVSIVFPPKKKNIQHGFCFVFFGKAHIQCVRACRRFYVATKGHISQRYAAEQDCGAWIKICIRPRTVLVLGWDLPHDWNHIP